MMMVFKGREIINATSTRVRQCVSHSGEGVALNRSYALLRDRYSPITVWRVSTINDFVYGKDAYK
jgi:hypothetical protein